MVALPHLGDVSWAAASRSLCIAAVITVLHILCAIPVCGAPTDALAAHDCHRRGGSAAADVEVHLIFSRNVYGMTAHCVESLLYSAQLQHAAAATAAATPTLAWCVQTHAISLAQSKHFQPGKGAAAAVAPRPHGEATTPTDSTAAVAQAEALRSQSFERYYREVYHHYLEVKLHTNARIVNTSRAKWLVLMDIDVQVFPGWVDMVQRLILAADRDRIHGFFQREDAKLVNTGVMLLRVGPQTRRMFALAQRRFAPHSGGDQRAVQKALQACGEALRRWTLGGDAAANSATKVSGAVQCEAADRTRYAFLPKDLVNAGVIDSRRGRVLIHHAHMAGAHKATELLKAVRLRYGGSGSASSSTSGAAGVVAPPSGVFLLRNASASPGGRVSGVGLPQSELDRVRAVEAMLARALGDKVVVADESERAAPVATDSSVAAVATASVTSAAAVAATVAASVAPPETPTTRLAATGPASRTNAPARAAVAPPAIDSDRLVFGIGVAALAAAVVARVAAKQRAASTDVG